VLDAGPLLSLSSLQGLAEAYLTVPEVLTELKDKRAREHFERLGLVSGVNVQVKTADAASLAHGVSSQLLACYSITACFIVISWAKKTGDYAVLSHPDLCVLALTYMLHEEGKRSHEKENEKLPDRASTLTI
jgi:RNA-binding protein NOB1